MKNLYSKRKGKVYPSLSSSVTCSSVLSHLPSAIMLLISVLGEEDREVLAYLVFRSLKPPAQLLEKQKCKKLPNSIHKPLLDCPCFDCYTSFWIRWDSSPNRELIHQAIEAFDEHLSKAESSKKPRKKDRKRTNPPSPGPVQNELEPEENRVEEVAPLAAPPAQAPACRSLVRKVWPDMMGMFNSRLWGLWNPNV